MEQLIDNFIISECGPNKVFRDKKGRIIFLSEEALDIVKLRKERGAFLDLGVRVRLYDYDMKHLIESYIIPNKVMDYSRDDADAVEGVWTPLGTIVKSKGLYIKYLPGIEEVGINDRGDVMLRLNEGRVRNGQAGPVINSVNTTIVGRTKRLETRLDKGESDKDKAEALNWLKALEFLNNERTYISKFMCAGINCTHKSNSPYLHHSTQVNFFDVDDPEMTEISAILSQRFLDIGRPVPKLTILSLMDIPASEVEYTRFAGRLNRRGKSLRDFNLPKNYSDSRFYCKESGRIVPANFVYFCPLDQLEDEITTITVNTDYHGEVKSRGVLSPLMAIMSLIGVISAHAGTAILNRRGTATTFTGPTGTGKTTACSFWAEKNEHYRRDELERRYRIELERESPTGEYCKEELYQLMEKVGILCQEDWIEIMKVENGKWVFIATEKFLYARTRGFPGLAYILAENEPLLENSYADFGASGQRNRLGTVTHEYLPERIFYDPQWSHFYYDRSPRKIDANVFLERNKELDFIVKKVSPEEAMNWLLIGRTPEGNFEPLYNAYPDFSGLLMDSGVVGEKLIVAYNAAKQGDYRLIGNGDEKLGEAIFTKLDIQVKLWLDNTKDIPTFIVNGAPGLEITQDVNWFLSEHTEYFDENPILSAEEFKQLMEERYGVTYGEKGEWTHFDRRMYGG